MQVMFSPEEDMLSCRRNFHFHWVPLLTGIYAISYQPSLLSAYSVKRFDHRNFEKGDNLRVVLMKFLIPPETI